MNCGLSAACPAARSRPEAGSGGRQPGGSCWSVRLASARAERFSSGVCAVAGRAAVRPGRDRGRRPVRLVPPCRPLLPGRLRLRRGLLRRVQDAFLQVHPGRVVVGPGSCRATLTSDRSTPPRPAASAIIPSSRASKTPASRHCRNRLCTVDQARNRSGIARHCAPERNFRITPSNCCRSRSGYGPYSPIGRYGSTNPHPSYVSCARLLAS